MRKTLKLTGDIARQAACRYIMQAPDGYTVTIGEQSRSAEANARLHAMISDVADQLEYMGRKRSLEFWKGLFVSGWEIATGQKPEIVAGIEGEFINIRNSTTKLSGRKIAELMQYIEAYGVSNGVGFGGLE